MGRGRGTLRYFLDPTARYLVVDPQIEAFEGIEFQPGFLEAYPFLIGSCNFLAGFAEHLPLLSRQFDFVHVRSVLDHTFDPYLAMREAYRVLKDDGKLVIGSFIQLSPSEPRIVHVFRRASGVLRDRGLRELVRIIYHKLTSPPDHNMWHRRENDLVDLVQESGFVVEKAVRQKPPFQNYVYMLCVKKLQQDLSIGEC